MATVSIPVKIEKNENVSVTQHKIYRAFEKAYSGLHTEYMDFSNLPEKAFVRVEVTIKVIDPNKKD